MKHEARFRLLSLLLTGIVSVGAAGCLTGPAKPNAVAARDSQAPSVVEASVEAEVSSTLETDAATEVERINSRGYQPFSAGVSSTDRGSIAGEN